MIHEQVPQRVRRQFTQNHYDGSVPKTPAPVADQWPFTNDETWNRWKGQMPVIYNKESS